MTIASKEKAVSSAAVVSEILLSLPGDVLAIIYDWNKEGRAELRELFMLLQKKIDVFASRNSKDWKKLISAEKEFLLRLAKNEEQQHIATVQE